MICSNIFSSSNSFALLHSQHDFHVLKRFLVKFGRNPCNQNLFFRAKTRFHLPPKRAIFFGFFIEFPAPHQPFKSTLAPLESSFDTLSNGAKLDSSRARGAIVQTFFFFENSRKTAKIARYEQKMYEQNLTINAHLGIFVHRSSAHSAKNKTGRFQHRDVQFENPLCHDPLLCMVRFDFRGVFVLLVFLKITQ